jgi:hypothetical protein
MPRYRSITEMMRYGWTPTRDPQFCPPGVGVAYICPDCIRELGGTPTRAREEPATLMSHLGDEAAKLIHLVEPLLKQTPGDDRDVIDRKHEVKEQINRVKDALYGA